MLRLPLRTAVGSGSDECRRFSCMPIGTRGVVEKFKAVPRLASICCALHKHEVQCLDFRERDARLYVVVRRELRRRSACPCLSPFCGLEEARFCWAAATISSM